MGKDWAKTRELDWRKREDLGSRWLGQRSKLKVGVPQS